MFQGQLSQIAETPADVGATAVETPQRKRTNMFAGKMTPVAATPLRKAYSRLLGVGEPPQEIEDAEQQQMLRERFTQLSGVREGVEQMGVAAAGLETPEQRQNVLRGVGDGDGQVGSMLGARPPVVKKWFPEITDEEWDLASSGQYAGADTGSILAKAQAVEAKWNAVISQYRAEGGCDATKPGRLAGALREYLIANGAEEDNLGDDPDTFGPLECKEWMKIFNKQPDLAAAKASMKAGYGNVQIGTPTYGWRTVYLSDVCGSNVKLPVCPPPGGGAPPPPKPECDGTTPCPSGQECVEGKCVPKPTSGGAKKSNLGLFVLAAGALGLAWVASRGQMASAYGERPRKP